MNIIIIQFCRVLLKNIDFTKAKNGSERGVFGKNINSTLSQTNIDRFSAAHFRFFSNERSC